MQLDRSKIENLEHVKRLNIINSITGIKPGNLIGSISNEGIENLAVFSSIIHLGSKPALLGFILRPYNEVPRHTYENILDNGYYTINAIPTGITKEAHFTSYKFEKDESEFETCGIEKVFLGDFKAPFVKESPIKIGLKHQQSIPIELNGTHLIIGSVEFLDIEDSLVAENGYLDLEQAGIAGIGGLNSYYALQKIEEYPYVRAENLSELQK